jgi:DNA-binding NtrC family response regulator
MSKVKVLIVDDEPDICEIISYEMEDRGFETTSANGGNEAIEKIKSNKYDLILSDVRMPNGSGVDIVNFVNTITGKKPKLILISAFSDVNEEEMRKKGVISILTKPIDFNLVNKMIDQALST